MGVSSDAYLVYGIPLSDEEEEGWSLYMEDHCYNLNELEEKGLYYCLLNNIDSYDFSEDDLYELYKNIKDEDIPFRLLTHCADNYPMHILYVPEHYYSAYRGYPEKIEKEDLEVDQKALDKFRAFVYKYFSSLSAVKIENEGWYLCSYWG